MTPPMAVTRSLVVKVVMCMVPPLGREDIVSPMPAEKKLSEVLGKPVTTVDFFGSVKGKVVKFRTHCPFCNRHVTAKRKGYLMVCLTCGQRID